MCKKEKKREFICVDFALCSLIYHLLTVRLKCGFHWLLGIHPMSTELWMKRWKKKMHMLCVFSCVPYKLTSSDCVSCSKAQLTNNMHIAYIRTVCEHTCHRFKPPHPAASALCGIKQTVIDLQYDCLFCLPVSDGWRFAHIWKVCMKYGGGWWGEGGV